MVDFKKLLEAKRGTEVCAVEGCGLPVRDTPSGTICAAGHGGAPTKFVLGERQQRMALLDNLSLRLHEARGPLEDVVVALDELGLGAMSAEVRGWVSRTDGWAAKIHAALKRRDP